MIGNQLTSAFTFLAFLTLAAGKPPPPADAPWAKFVSKPVYARSLGPPPMSGVGTISVPYIPKPGMFPKFVDPRIMIAKKTDLLGTLFGGLGPAMGPSFGSATPYAGYGSTANTYPGGMYGTEGNVASYSSSDDTGNLPILYGSSFDPKTEYFESPGDSLKRGLFGPFGSKSSMGGPFYAGSGAPDAPASGSSEFFRRGLLGPKLPVAPGFSGATDTFNPETKMADPFSKNTESLTDVNQSLGTGTTQGPPPAYPKIHTIPEETEKPVGTETKESSLEKIFGTLGGATSKSLRSLSKRMVPDADSVPKEYLPGMFGPMGPGFGPPGFGPPGFGYGPFMSKKSMFLDTLFKNLATSTPSPVTDIPVTEKSTIVPPGFWLPETIVPDPGAYNAKVATFLDKLFDSLKLNASKATGDSPLQAVTYEESISAGFPGEKIAATRSLPFDYPGAGSSPYFNDVVKSVRSLPDPEAVIIAKDQIVNAIIGELGVLKNDMMTTFNELVAYQKNISTPLPGAKPFKPFVPPFWSASSSSAAMDLGTLPYKQRMVILNQVFDMLTELQLNVSSAVNDAVKSSYAEEIPEITTTIKPDITSLDISVLDEILGKLNELNTIALPKAPTKGFPSKFSRSLPSSQTSFWVAYPGGDQFARRDTIEGQEIPRSNGQNFAEENGKDKANSFTTGKDSRAIKMQMHQGYQSLPPGTIESIQAGGGSVPGHEGGGVKLLIKMPAYDTATRDGGQEFQDILKWQDSMKTTGNEYNRNRNHHHHDRY